MDMKGEKQESTEITQRTTGTAEIYRAAPIL